MERFVKFLKDWSLPVSMITGIALYLVYYFTPALKPVGPAAYSAIKFIQPLLIFMMLFLQFNKVSPHDLKIKKWHVIIAAIQCSIFLILAVFASIVSSETAKVVLECAMLCFVCPTATAAGVITSKLGGSISSTMTYVVLINCLVSFLFPAILPMLVPDLPYSFAQSFFMVARKVFSILILPCLTAWVIRYTMRKVQVFFMRYTEFAFYVWIVALCLALVMTTRQLVHSNVSVWTAALMCLVTFVCCLFQFVVGRHFGGKTGECDKVTAGQAFGQKNTVFAIWLGYTFLNPVTSVAGGFYSLAHNAVNSYQLYKVRKEKESQSKD
ncbi:MAG: transporter [Bacteroidales bacterium]|nr:transporter [Bacteroidales bacterium]